MQATQGSAQWKSIEREVGEWKGSEDHVQIRWRTLVVHTCISLVSSPPVYNT